MRSIEELESLASQRNHSLEQGYFFALFVVLMASAISDPYAKVVFDLASFTKLVGPLCSTLIGGGLLYLVLKTKFCPLEDVENRFISWSISLFLIIWGCGALYSNSIIFSDFFSIKKRISAGGYYVSGQPDYFYYENRTLVFSLNGKAYDVRCSYGCNAPYASFDSINSVTVHLLKANDEVFKIEVKR